MRGGGTGSTGHHCPARSVNDRARHPDHPEYRCRYLGCPPRKGSTTIRGLPSQPGHGSTTCTIRLDPDPGTGWGKSKPVYEFDRYPHDERELFGDIPVSCTKPAGSQGNFYSLTTIRLKGSGLCILPYTARSFQGELSGS
jgi:hypothetical protein